MRTMKTIWKSAIVATLVLAFTACSDDDDNGGSSTPAGYYLTAKVDGQNYSNSNLFDPTAVVAGGMLMIQSSTNSGDAIQIQIPNYTGPGTYNSGNNDLTAGFVNFMDMGATVGQFTSYTSVRGTGQVIVTEDTAEKVEGTFTATAFENVEGSTNDVAITQGSFRAEKN